MASQAKRTAAKKDPTHALCDEQELKKFLRKTGRKIAESRVQAGRTQAQFADQAGVCVKMVQYWESGQNVTLKTLYKIAKQLGQPIESFLQEVPEHALESTAFRLPSSAAAPRT